MSLINEALKKAQRQRNDDPAALTAPIPGGGARVAKRGQPKSANTVLLLGSGALVLVVLSVVLTVYLLNRSDPTPPPVVARVQPVAPQVDPAAGITPPLLAPPPPLPESTKAPTETVTPPVAATPPPNPPTEAPKSSPPLPVETPTRVVETKSATVPVTPPRPAPLPPAPAPAPVTPQAAAPLATTPPATAPAPVAPAPAAPVKIDDRIATFVETLRITGVKAAGADSRVLMNDRVYRLNEIVDRTLGLRLINVEANSLTFSDANGANYVKHF